jgi:amino acid adenylation domain-containing protein
VSLPSAELSVAPASFAQQRLWFLDRLEPGSARYNIPLAVRLTGALDRAAVAQALTAIGVRHEILRTTFAVEEGELMQVIHPGPFRAWREEKVRDEAALAGALVNEARRPFDLVTGPLWRAVLFSLQREDHVLLLTLHHIVADGWSLGVLSREFSACYAGFAEGAVPSLPELPVQYADFAVWQRDWLQGDVLAEQVGFWQRTLAGAPAVLSLPTDRPRPRVLTAAGRTQRFSIAPDVTRALHDLARHAGVSLFMTLLGGFAVLLRRWTGQDDLVIGTPVAGRTRGETEPLVGFFVNSLPLRLDLAGDPTVRDLLHRVRTTALEAFAHQDVPFEKLVQELQAGRALGHTPLFQIMFALQNAPLDALRLPGLTAAALEVDLETAKYDLSLVLEESGGGLTGRLEYNCDLFADTTAARVARQFTCLLGEIVRAAGARIDALRLQDAAEERRLVYGWNDTARSYPEQDMAALFAGQAACHAGAVALRFGGAELTYAQLDARANQLAHLLRAAGVGPDVCVGVCLARSFELIVALVAIIKAGGAYLALDPDYPLARLEMMLEDTGARVVVTTERLAAQLPVFWASSRAGDGPANRRPAGFGLGDRGQLICVDRDAARIDAQPATDPLVRVTLEHLAYVSYTSGSTGQPKGAAIPQRGVVRLVRNTDYADLGAGETFLHVAPLSFDASTFEIWAALLNGGRLVVMPPGPSSLEELGRAIVREKVTTLLLTTGLFNALVDERSEDLRGLRQLLTGGEVCSMAHARKVLQALPDCRLINAYGPTENTTITTCHTVRASDLDGMAVPIGRPIANTRVYVLDESGRPVPVGVPGELWTAGDGLARGYLARPDLTAGKFVADPFANGVPGARLYRTGDRVRWREDGTLEFFGRRDHQVKIRGHRIEPAETEAALLALPDVKAAAVMVRETETGRQLVAYVVSPIGGEELRMRLQARLPEYLLPATIVTLAALPLRANGKVNRAALPAPERRAAGDVAAPPRNATEEILADLWGRLLGVERVGREEDFFALGGHSLLATRLVTRIREVFAVELPLRAVFETPTVAGLAAAFAAARPEDAANAPPLRSVPRDADLPLSFAQERMWFLHQLEPDNPFYNMPAALRLRGAFDVDAAGRVVREMVRRHEALRTLFTAVDGRPRQTILPALEVPIQVVELQHRPESERAGAVQRLTAAEARKPFDLARGPLLRIGLLRLAPDEHVLLLTMHHIVSDGWSMGVLAREMGGLYAAFAEGRGSALPELSIQYADYAVWQRQWLQGSVLAAQVAYWRQQLKGAPPVLKLPTDRARPAVQSFRGGSHAFQIGRELTGALQTLSREAGATLFMTLETAFAALLARYCDQDDIVIGTPIANRQRAEVEPLIGFFVNTLVLRNDFSGRPSFRAALARVRRAALEAYAHQDLPFERLVDELQPERDLSRNPVFQVMFALHNAPHREIVQRGLTMTELSAERISAQFDLVLDVWETPEGLKAVFEYATDLFDATTVGRMAGHLQVLLAAVAAAPDTAVATLPLLTPAERGQVLDGFNATAMAYPQDQTLQALIEAQVAATPDRIAAVHHDRRLTYAQLNAEANRLARQLRALGVGRGSFVGILEERGLDFLTALVAILKAGAAFLPIDPGYPADRVRMMIGDSAIAILITRGSVLARFPAVCGGASLRDLVLLDDAGNLDFAGALPRHPRSRWAEGSPDNDGVRGDPADAAYLLYTSGSTGRPKGAVLRHNGAVNHIYAQFRALAFHAGTAFLQSAPSSSDISVWQFLAPLLIGGRTVIADFETVCDPARLFRLVREAGITLIEFVPVVLKEFLDHAATLPPAERALPALEFAMVTGEAVSVALVNQWFHTYGPLRLVNAYGPTEAADDICQAILTGPLPAASATVPIGRPLGNLTLYVLDRERQLVPIGVPGELCVSGVGVGAGYWRNEEQTRAAFIPNPWAEATRGDVLYRTGDVGRWLPDGNLEMLGRFDQQVKLRGFRIELGEIESQLSQHPAVAETAVEIRAGEGGDKHLVAYVTVNGAGRHETLAALARQQVQLWQDLHEDSYADTLTYADGDPTFNVIGWDSNYTGQPLSEREMREYVGHTIERVRELRPRRVLEIGCGTGLLLFRLAPECEHYLGTDLSGVAIRRLEALRSDRAGLGHVELRAQRADEFTGIAPASYDVVMLCSVVQYFPGVDYLLTVLAGALRAVRAGGAVFIGDVRIRALLPAFHASVQLCKASDSLTAADLRRRVRAALQREQEMAIEPPFFVALRARFPQIGRVDVRPKRGTVHNELTRFRCDVTLHVGDPLVRPTVEQRDAPPSADEWQSWPDRPLTLAEIRAMLADGRAALGLRRVANPRVQRELRTLAWLESAPADARIGDFRAALDGEPPDGIEPEELIALAAADGWAVDIALVLDADDGCYDAGFRRLGRDVAVPAPVAPSVAVGPRPWHSYANNPLREKMARELVPQLRGFLRERLPGYMVPADFVVLETMPQLPNGKVDRAALPAPEIPVMAEGSYVAPRTAAEAKLAEIWGAVLGLERVSVTANFFELGGHSLKATQVVSRIQREFGVEVALREMFSQPTIAELAAAVDGRRSVGYQPLPRIADAEDYPLSHAQLRLWVLAHLEGARTAYNMPAAVRLEGAVDSAALERVFGELVRRHESLRTTFVLVEGKPRQRVHAAPLGRLEVIDVSAAADPEARARELALEQADEPFALDRGPLLRIALVRLAAEAHVLLFNIHHIVSDDWSMGVLVREFIRLHDGFAAGDEPVLPPLRLHYRDYAAWQNAQLAADGMAAHRDYWRTRFAGELPGLNLPADFPRPPVKTYRGRTHAFALESQVGEGLREIARSQQATLFMVLTAAVQALLQRETGQRDLIVGCPIAGRTHPDLEDQIGFYVNTLPLRAHVDPQAAFTALLAQVRATATAAYEHQAYPFDRLVDDLALARDVTRTPLFDVVVVMQNVDPYALALGGAPARPFLDDFGGSKFDLQFNFEERDGAVAGSLVYNPDLFTAARIAGFVGHLQTLLESITADATQPVGRLAFLPAGERRRLLTRGNGGSALYPRNRTLATWFEAQAARSPGAAAVTLHGETVSYGELNARANRLARRLRRLGVGPEVLVGLFFERSIELVVAIVAVAKAGGAYVPMDPVYPAERIGFMLEDARPRVLLTPAKHAEFCRALLAGAERQNRPPAGSDQTELLVVDPNTLADESTEDLPALAGPDHAAYVIYTSGSTGQPKGCIVTHYQVVRLFEATQAWYGFDGSDVWTLFHSCAFDFSVWEIWGALLHGGRLVVVPHATSRAPDQFLALLRTEGVTVLNQTPSAFRQLIAAEESAFVPAGLPALRLVIFGGETLDPASLRPWWQRFGNARPRLVNMYGITETTVHVTYRPLAPCDAEGGGSPIGGPIPDLQIYLLDPFLQPVPVGVAGEIFVGGAGVARGYLNRPELTADRFMPDPFSGCAGARLYRSGDLARWRSGGELEYLGRADHQVKIRGFRIELGEIEAVLAAHPAVGSALVMLRDDVPGDPRLAAYVVWRGAGATTAELREHVRRRVPDYMVPAGIVPLDAFPLTPNGKIDRRALPRPGAAPAVVPAFAAPQDELEATIARLWCEALGVERVDRDANFFELGGHSVLIVSVHQRLRAALKRELSVVDLFKYATVATLAEFLRTAPGAADAGMDEVRERARQQQGARQRRGRGGRPA